MTTRPPAIAPSHQPATSAGTRPTRRISRHAAPKRPPNRQSAAPNKPNLPRDEMALTLYLVGVYSKSSRQARAQKQTQSNPIPPQPAFAGQQPVTPGPPAPNKPNRRRRPERSRTDLPRFWPKNADRPRKQTQSKPISSGRACRFPFFHLALERPGFAAIMAHPRQAKEMNFLLGEVSKWQMHRRATQS